MGVQKTFSDQMSDVYRFSSAMSMYTYILYNYHIVKNFIKSTFIKTHHQATSRSSCLIDSASTVPKLHLWGHSLIYGIHKQELGNCLDG